MIYSKYNFCQHNLMKGMIVYLLIKNVPVKAVKARCLYLGQETG